MKCPACDCPETVVMDSRPTGGDTAVRRRRRCLNCGHRVTTMEMVVTEHQQRGAANGRLNEMAELLESIGQDDADFLLQLGRRFAHYDTGDSLAIPMFRRQALGVDA